MHHRPGAFRAALLTGWIGLSAAGFLYARAKQIPLWAAVPIIAAFLVEYSFYLVPGFETVREKLRTRLSRRRLAVLLAAAAVLPYLIYSIPTGQFRAIPFLDLAALAVALCFWYVALRPSPFTDSLFLAFVAAVVFSRVLDSIYLSPIHIHLNILGKLMLIHTGAMVMLELRGIGPIGFGFLPTQSEWVIGVRYFLYFLPVGVGLSLWLRLAHFSFVPFLFGKTLATFFGALWVVALSEEFFFRGLLQQWLTDWTHRPYFALALASILFGAAHLPFRAFPNWRLALVAAISGWFYGMAYRRAGSIRAGMVAHALVVTVWRTLFT
ncbi:MAG TPA: CPBP family intramembrane glutamic endopeptidase [Bryobacteraceae bacterium]|nr:CPBP family intramembrane glutamic endopeptidase [Bryobacteraceae bacterium]